MKNFKREKEDWKRGVLEEAKSRHPERKESFETASGIRLEGLNTPDDNRDYLEETGFPGQFPFTRGIYPTMYRGRLWTMRQYAGYATAKESNRRFRYLLEQGQTGLSVAFDLPTQMGYDSDHTMSSGEVGKVGVPVSSLRDMEVLFGGIPLDKVSTSMTINATAAILLAMYIAVAEKQGIPRSKLSGTVQNDILKEYIARGTYIFPPGASMRLVTDIFSYCKEHVPLWNTISISGYHMREAGATAVQEVAFTFSNAIAYVEAAQNAGLKIEQFAPRLSFFFGVHNEFLEEVAKFRSARRLWAKIVSERFGCDHKAPQLLRFHAQTDGSTLTAQQPLNNIVRVSLQALAAVLGGAQSLHCNSFDEALSLPSEEGAGLALRTQQIMAYEAGITSVVDPLGGSYTVEYLTDEIEKNAVEYIEKIDAMGGAVKAIGEGYIQDQIHQSAYRYQKEIEGAERVVVGVNKFTEKDEQRDLFRVDPHAEKIQIENLNALKSARENKALLNSLSALKSAARGNDNLMPSILDAVKSYATVGEICDVLREVFGVQREFLKF